MRETRTPRRSQTITNAQKTKDRKRSRRHYIRYYYITYTHTHIHTNVRFTTVQYSCSEHLYTETNDVFILGHSACLSDWFTDRPTW